MPFKRILPKDPATYPDLVDCIADELAAERPDGPPGAPMIIEEQTPRTHHLQVTVVWDRWDELSKQDRGRVIMDAYNKIRGLDEMLKISMVLGLTHREAERLGILSKLAGVASG